MDMNRATKILLVFALIVNFAFMGYLVYKSINSDYEIAHLLDVISDAVHTPTP